MAGTAGSPDDPVVSVQEFDKSGSGRDVLRLRGNHLDVVIAAARATLAGTPASPRGTAEGVTK
jgi:transketolase